MLSQNVFSGVLWMDMLSVAQCPEHIGVTAISGLLPLYLCIIARVVHRQRRVRLFLEVLLHQYRYRVSSVYEAIQSDFIDVFSVVLNFVLVNSIKELCAIIRHNW